MQMHEHVKLVACTVKKENILSIQMHDWIFLSLRRKQFKKHAVNSNALAI